MAVALAGLNYGNRSVFDHRVNKSAAAPRDKQVDVLIELHHCVCNGSGGVLDKLYCVFVYTAVPERRSHKPYKRFVGVYRVASAAEYNRVARFEAKGCRVYRDIRAGLENNTDSSDRDTLFNNVQSVRKVASAYHCTNRVGK